ncbi:hypothetical protein ACE6H2_007911 [Prunus campanulata]
MWLACCSFSTPASRSGSCRQAAQSKILVLLWLMTMSLNFLGLQISSERLRGSS